jgi:hypothetical protein
MSPTNLDVMSALLVCPGILSLSMATLSEAPEGKRYSNVLERMMLLSYRFVSTLDSSPVHFLVTLLRCLYIEMSL